jgi:hypothetical protein
MRGERLWLAMCMGCARQTGWKARPWELVVATASTLCSIPHCYPLWQRRLTSTVFS